MRRAIPGRSAAAVVFAAAAAGPGATAARAADPVPTGSAAAFHDSVGVVTHDGYTDTPYARTGDVVAALRDLGVGHVRDGVYASADLALNARQQRNLTAFAQAGLKLTLTVNRDCSGGAGPGPCLDVVRDTLPDGSVEAVEWPHEDDRFGTPGWPQLLAGWGRELHARVKADPALRNLTVIGPSLARDGSPELLGSRSGALDVGNIHPFTGGTSPDPTQVVAELRRIAVVSESKPVQATAAGFATAPAATVADQPPTDEATAAVYTLRTVLEHWSAGIGRTFIYELLDERADPLQAYANFGLLRADLTPKPAYRALRNLLVLVGRGGPVRIVPLRYQVDTEAPDLRQVVLQQADGGYLVVLWRTASVWDTGARRPRAVAPRGVTVTVPGAQSFATGSPLASSALDREDVPASGRIVLTVGDEPRVLRVTTAAGAVAGVGPVDDAATRPGSAPSTAGPGRAASGPRLTRLRIRKVGAAYRATFTLASRVRATGRLERRTGRSPRYRTTKRLGRRALPAGARRMTLGRLRAGRHRLFIDLRDAKGQTRRYAIRFTARANRARR